MLAACADAGVAPDTAVPEPASPPLPPIAAEVRDETRRRFHADYRQGTAAQVRARERRVKMATVIVVEVEDLASVDWAEHAERGDFPIVHE